jgi:putative ABC transport system ATP-binding protein
MTLLAEVCPTRRAARARSIPQAAPPAADRWLRQPAAPQALATAAVPPAAGLAVECRSLVKEFCSGDTRVQAVRGVDWQVPEGELTLLVGPSGCGKTTLLSIVAGLLEPTSGEVYVFNQALHDMPAGRKVHFRGHNLGFVFQQYNLLPSLTVTENAAVPLLALGWQRRRAFARAREVVESVGLGPRADYLPAQLSGGQQQRVAIARALVHEPRLLVCDEPTAALDAQNGQTVMQLIRSVAVQAGRAVIVVTHDSRIYHFGDRIVHMSDGAITRLERQTRTELQS